MKRKVLTKLNIIIFNKILFYFLIYYTWQAFNNIQDIINKKINELNKMYINNISSNKRNIGRRLLHVKGKTKIFAWEIIIISPIKM